MPSNTHPTFPTTPLTRLTHPHNTPIHALTFSSGSGQYILTGSSDRTIRLFNPTTSRLIQTYTAHGYEILDLAVTTDNSRFVSVGGDKTVFLWDVASAQTLRRFNGHVGRVNTCAFGGEGGEGSGESVVVSGSFDGTVKCWDLRSRSEKAIMSFAEARDGVSAVAVLGGEIYAGSTDGRVRVYDLRMGVVDVDFFGAKVAVTSVSPARAGDCYLVSTLDSRVRLMERAKGRCLQTFADGGYGNETYRVRSMLAMGDAYAASGSEGRGVFVWDVLTGKLVERVWHTEGGGEERGSKRDVVSAVAWNQLRKQWASAGGDGTVVVWGFNE